MQLDLFGAAKHHEQQLASRIRELRAAEIGAQEAARRLRNAEVRLRVARARYLMKRGKWVRGERIVVNSLGRRDRTAYFMRFTGRDDEEVVVRVMRHNGMLTRAQIVLLGDITFRTNEGVEDAEYRRLEGDGTSDQADEGESGQG